MVTAAKNELRAVILGCRGYFLTAAFFSLASTLR